MASKLEKSKESSNELIELFDKVKKELDARKRENDCKFFKRQLGGSRLAGEGEGGAEEEAGRPTKEVLHSGAAVGAEQSGGRERQRRTGDGEEPPLRDPGTSLPASLSLLHSRERGGLCRRGRGISHFLLLSGQLGR